MPTKLDERVLSDALTALPGWEGGPAGLTRTVSLPEDQTATLLRTVDEAAASMDHHPDVARDGGRTTFTLVTHSLQGVSELDVMLASRISGLVDLAQGKRLVGAQGIRGGGADGGAARGASVGSASRLSDATEVSTAGAEGHSGPGFGDRRPASGEPTIGVPAVAQGSVIEPGVAMPDTAPNEPEPGIDVGGNQGG